MVDVVGVELHLEYWWREWMYCLYLWYLWGDFVVRQVLRMTCLRLVAAESKLKERRCCWIFLMC